uniref:Uncharacterized protein n=1 Tax=Ceratitis capitata TaxID=7213 RepID=W8C508_CERCA
MTSSNINKIVRSNITLKPWILSKNTTEIVNTCIQKIYKQSQNNFKNDQTKIAAAKPENKGPIRALKTQERARVPLSINVTRAKKAQNASENAGATAGTVVGGVPASTAAASATGERLASKAAANNRRGAVANLSAHRRLLKTSSPNYKIYSSRRFGSSASSSNASIFRRNEERRRSTTQTAQLNYLLRTYATQMRERAAISGNTLIPKFMVSARNQHMATRVNGANIPPHVLQTSSIIQRELMPINSDVKDRIALGRPRLTKTAPQKPKSQDPMSGWNHPPSQELFLARFNQHGIANNELQEQYRRMKNANKMRQFEQLRQMEKRNAILGTVMKKDMRHHALKDFESKMGMNSPSKSPQRQVRQQTPSYEHAYLTRVTRQQADAADTETTALIPVSEEPPAAASSAAAMQPASAAQHTSTTFHTHSSVKQAQEAVEQSFHEPTVAAQTTATSASGTITSKILSVPAAETQQPEAPFNELPMPLAITKKSATSQWACKAANAQNAMRFSHSVHLKKF